MPLWGLEGLWYQYDTEGNTFRKKTFFGHSVRMVYWCSLVWDSGRLHLQNTQTFRTGAGWSVGVRSNNPLLQINQTNGTPRVTT